MDFFKLVLESRMTAIICGITFLLFLWFVYRLIIIGVFSKKIRKQKSVDDIESIKEFASLLKKYKSTIVFPDKDNNMKTDEEAELYFNLNSCLNSIKINYRILNAASGLMVGLGLLGTFIGLTMGVLDFNSDSTEAIQRSINELLGGMGTAFATSLFGMGFSILYIFIEKITIHKFQKNINSMCVILDDAYYISQTEKYSLIYKRQNENLMTLFLSKDEDGNVWRPGNVFRYIYEECQKQTTFLHDSLEDEIFQQANKAMRESLDPLVTQVNDVAKTLGDKLDSFANSVKSPGDNMATGIVNDLKEAIDGLVKELQSTLSGKMDGMDTHLDSAVRALSDFPQHVQNMTNIMNENFGNIQNLVNGLASKTASTNDGILQSVKEQIALATTNMNNLTQNLQTTMNGIREQFADSSKASTKEIENMIEKMGKVMQQVNGQTIQTNNSIIDRQKRTNEDTIAMVDELKKLIEEVKNTLNQFENVQVKANETTANLHAVSSDASNMTNNLQSAQRDLGNQCRQNNIATDRITQALNTTLEVPELYGKSFGDIKNALKVIFEDLTQGLTNYSRTVEKNTQSLLDTYSHSVTEGMQQLQGAIESLSSVVEEISELRPNNNVRR